MGKSVGGSTGPLFAVYVAWHPKFRGGGHIAEALRQYFRRDIYDDVTGGLGISVLFRSTPLENTALPGDINLREAKGTAIILLAEEHMASDPDWIAYVRNLADRADKTGLHARLFPVSIGAAGMKLGIQEQALRWDSWAGNDRARTTRLIRELVNCFCRIMRHCLARLQRPGQTSDGLPAYLQKVKVFLSHSKHDNRGESIASRLREHLQAEAALASFFDVQDIPAGLRFDAVLLTEVRLSAMVAIHTDSYSSREWCRREVIEAKRCQVPFIVANCLGHIDERSFPYLGNVPIIQLHAASPARIDVLVCRLLEEVLRDLLWRCRIESSAGRAPHVLFLARPPELLSLLASADRSGRHTILERAIERREAIVVYPDPPLSAEEERLLHAVAPRVQLRSFTEWRAGVIR